MKCSFLLGIASMSRKCVVLAIFPQEMCGIVLGIDFEIDNPAFVDLHHLIQNRRTFHLEGDQICWRVATLIRYMRRDHQRFRFQSGTIDINTINLEYHLCYLTTINKAQARLLS
jgi:hypothetical protein